MRYDDNPFLYTLSGEDPVPTDDPFAWCVWFEKADRVIERTEVGDASILTTFTGLNRPSWPREDQPVLWETTIFGGTHHGRGQRHATKMAARVGHELWCDVARGEITPDRVKEVSPPATYFDHEDRIARSTDDSTTWLLCHEAYWLIGTDETTIKHFEQLGVLHPRHVTYPDPLHYPRYGETPKLSTVTYYDLAEVIDICRRSRDLPRRRWGHIVTLPEHLKPIHAEILDRYVVPGVISLPEFRVRYGYQCKRFGKHRYRVRRANETTVCIESSPLQAWKVAYQLEQERLAPILIARDAIVTGRILEAFQIVDQLSSDLAVPLRREITRATMPPELAAELAETE